VQDRGSIEESDADFTATCGKVVREQIAGRQER